MAKKTPEASDETAAADAPASDAPATNDPPPADAAQHDAASGAPPDVIVEDGADAIRLAVAMLAGPAMSGHESGAWRPDPPIYGVGLADGWYGVHDQPWAARVENGFIVEAVHEGMARHVDLTGLEMLDAD